MYVKWQKQKLSSGRIVIRALIVKSFRDPHGKVRKEIIGYLGSIHEWAVKFPIARRIFWRKLELKLAALTLSEHDAAKIRRKIAERVPRDATVAHTTAFT
jgi:hypothetical protein